MKNKQVRFGLMVLLIAFCIREGQAQNAIQNLIVETYYVSDANDATHDDEGTTLPEGSVTYRIYLDLAPNVRIKSIFGNENHPWILESTENFWNNSDRGEFFGYDVRDNRLDENTVALDSWFTLGAASDEHFGILKESDTDGSIIGGENNDGGSEEMEGGLLVNATAEMGIPLTQADGLLPWPESEVLPDFVAQGVDDLEAILSDQTVGNSFQSGGNSILQFPGGVGGLNEENIVLIAQLTTTGELSFKLNVVLDVPGMDDEVIYVADGGNLQPDEVESPFLSFPPECGCTDPDYLEFDPGAPCDDGSCETLIVFGCADVNACNFNPSANVNVPELCCFSPDSCNGLDWTIVCPALGREDDLSELSFHAFPNPTLNTLNLEITLKESQEAQITIYDLNGRSVRQEQLFLWSGTQLYPVNMSDLSNGTYLLRLSGKFFDQSILVVKN